MEENRGGNEEENKEQDRYLPIANIGRIMKQALPKDAKIAKEARETVQECVSEFISFITSEACEKCKNDKRKTINGDDLLFSLNQLGFDRYLENLHLYYAKYKEAAKSQEKLESSNKNNESHASTGQETIKKLTQNNGQQQPKMKKEDTQGNNTHMNEEEDDDDEDEQDYNEEDLDEEEDQEEVKQQESKKKSDNKKNKK